MHIKKDWKCCEKSDGSTISVEMPEGFKHHSKAVCAYCNHFVRWLPNPQLILEQQQNQAKILELKEHNDDLCSFDRIFLNEMDNRKKLSSKQKSYLDKIYSEKIRY